ncbi:MAG: hypothetical protein PWQ17_864 [Anaerophaga sp.]|nr:hypothetical protein [Anaerophaga sp.]MDK2841359.1 hypothetical protein [Anaerophaga sp.]MDN5292177.1 hypothetical protein [Anaerophaga sp.]
MLACEFHQTNNLDLFYTDEIGLPVTQTLKFDDSGEYY